MKKLEKSHQDIFHINTQLLGQQRTQKQPFIGKKVSITFGGNT